MDRRSASVRRARRQKGVRQTGFIVTWDVDSRDRSLCARLHRFVFGYVLEKSGRKYGYPGFVEREGVRYLGQSVLFVRPSLLAEIEAFLSAMRIDHEATPASVG